MKEISIKTLIVLTLAGLVNSTGISLFLSPVHIYDSGISGLSMLINQVTGLPLGIFLLILNLPLFLYGYKKQGFAFTFYAIYTICFYALGTFVYSAVLKGGTDNISPVAGDDLVLCTLFGGVLSGIGSGLAIRFGGAMDGIEVLAVIFAKRLGITVGTFVMSVNLVIYFAAGFVTGSWKLPLYSIVTYYVGLKMIDFIVEGIDRAKSVMIITVKPSETAAVLSEEFGSGVTMIGAKGFYSDEDKTVIYFVVNRFQIGKLRRLVQKTDPDAFITVSEVAEVYKKQS